jgi:hypothetical protein
VFCGVFVRVRSVCVVRACDVCVHMVWCLVCVCVRACVNVVCACVWCFVVSVYVREVRACMRVVFVHVW